MALVHTSQGFVRALKGTADPPITGGPTKIELAAQAWNDVSFHLPNKAEVIVEWIVTKLLKEKDKEALSNPILDLRVWTLLYNITSSCSSPAHQSHTRPLKAWLPALLSRILLPPVILSLLGLLPGLDPTTRKPIIHAVSKSLIIIWPLCTQKLNTETILECLAALLDVYRVSIEINEDLAHIGIVLASSYRNSLLNSSNKKKVYHVFLENCMPQWLEVAAQSSQEEPYETFYQSVYDSGIETIFNLDIMRHIRESRTEHVLFQSITPIFTSNAQIYTLLPRIFASYIESVKKYRGALFGQGSTRQAGISNAEIQAHGIQFFASCLPILDAQESSIHVWPTRVEMLTLVNQEDLFNRNQREAELLLHHVIDQALGILETQTGSNLTAYAMETLSTLARIDYDIIIPLIPRVLPQLLILNGQNMPSYTFLDLVLAYHTKTRTMNTYIETALSGVLPQGKPSAQNSPLDIYNTSYSSPFFASAHLQRLSKAVHVYLAGTQVLSTATSTYQFLKDAWEKYKSSELVGDERSPKRRKTTEGDVTRASVADRSAVAFSLCARIASIVFSSLPMHKVTPAMRQDIFTLLNDLHDFTGRIVKKAVKMVMKHNGDEAWSISIVAVASLRLQYALDISGFVTSSVNQERIFKRVSEALQDETLLPELLLELSRFLLNAAPTKEQTASRTGFDYVLQYLEKNFKASKVLWYGQTHLLTLGKQGRRDCALALMHLIVERWLPAIESFASSEQLERFIRIIMSIDIAKGSEDTFSGLTAQTLLLQMLHSAQFLELPRVRTTFLGYLHQVISTLEAENPNITPALISSNVSAYRLLLLLPVDYFCRSSRAEFTRRALILDQYITKIANQSLSTYENLIVLRTFLDRMFSHTNAPEQSVQTICETLTHLMSQVTQQVDDFIPTTMGLIKSLFLHLLKKVDKSTIDTVLDILRNFAQIDMPISQTEVSTFRARGITQMVRVLETDFKVSSFPDELQSAFHQLYQALSMVIYPTMRSIVIDVTSEIELIKSQSNLIILWCSLLSLGRWLAVTGSLPPSIGRRLISQVVVQRPSDTKLWNEMRVTSLAILFQEFSFYPENGREVYLDTILAACLSLYRALDFPAHRVLDGHLSKLCNGLSVPEFSHALALIQETLRYHGSPEEKACLLQISVILLRDHPPRTMKQMQIFSTQCLRTFSGWCGLIDGPIECRLQTLDFVAQHCIERPAVLRLGDLGGIWSLITRFLLGSRVHDDGTAPEIFRKIILIISALIRLRRDLVTHILPHLGGTLCQLIMTLRSVRPNLGVRQTLLVTDTQPRWWNAEQPLGIEEAKSLSRLLEAVTAKNMIRNNAVNAESQKAESLAKPFSKHAGYVVLAYIAAMNDPLCVLPLEHRKELRQGLYALCSMMSDHSRDALMMGALDAGGKVTMKALWKEYEKQRYIGKG